MEGEGEGEEGEGESSLYFKYAHSQMIELLIKDVLIETLAKDFISRGNLQLYL